MQSRAVIDSGLALGRISTPEPTAKDTATITPSNTPAPCGPPGGWVPYTVQPGDTMFSLARSHGVSVDRVLAANCLSSTRLKSGKRIFLPPLSPTGTPTPAPAQTPPPTAGADGWPEEGINIVLQVAFSPNWPWDEVHWQELEITVQWQAADGQWHDVQGWKGTLNQVITGEEEQVIGIKSWWVGEAASGAGYFRWLVNRCVGCAPLAASEPFYLPSYQSVTLRVDVSLDQF